MRSRRWARALVAAGEVLAASVLAGLAWWCWHRGVIVTPSQGLQLSRIDGRWWATATGVATLAGILALDAGRQGVLAVAPRPSRTPSRAAVPDGR
ncbi:MAG TPA: hypothetical protein VGO16_07780 [Pseudonocardiaceae bacterium]|nr:hypothetical protein [Pseudonocardiaceae bacterium]